MGDLFWNKLIGALLASALAIFGIRELGHALIHPHEPAEPGYKIAIADEGDATEIAVEAVEEISLAQRLSEASASAGERVAKKCAACHSFDKDGANKIGPNLWNVLGNPSASNAGFGYSPAMQGFGGTWDYETLNAFLANPKAVVPGTAMSFAGLKKAKDGANILVYLRSLSDAPLALPALPISLSDASEAADGGNGIIETIVDAAEAVFDTAEDGAEALADVITDDEPAEEPATEDQPE